MVANILLIKQFDPSHPDAVDIVATLTPAGHHVVRARTFAEGCSAFDQGDWDLIMFDPDLADEPQAGTALALTAIERHVPIVLITGDHPAASRATSLVRVVTRPQLAEAAPLLQLVEEVLHAAPSRDGQGGADYGCSSTGP